MARFPAGIVRSTPVVPTFASAPGIWTLAEALQARAQRIWPRSPGASIDLTVGTNIGDMTASGGLAAAFDGTTNQAAAACSAKGAATSAYVGKTLSASKAIERALVFGSNNQGYVNGANPSMTITLMGKQGGAPANASDGTTLGSITFTDTADESTGRGITSNDPYTEWAHVWVRMDGAGSVEYRFAELQLWGY
jgi:hypothetical protein